MDVLVTLHEDLIVTASSSVNLISADQSQIEILLFLSASPVFSTSIQLTQQFDCKLEGVYITEGVTAPDVGGYFPLAWS